MKEPQQIIEPLNPLLLALYTTFVIQMEKLDQFGYARAHLQDKKYSKTWSVFAKLIEIESRHNQEVSDYHEDLLPSLWKSIHEATHLMDVSLLYKRLKYDENVEDIAKKSIAMGAFNQTVGLYTPYLFEYLLKRYIDPDNKGLLDMDLRIKDEVAPGGWVFHVLTSNRYLDEKKILAKSNPVAMNDLKKLKDILLNDDMIKITLDLQRFKKQTQEIEDLYKEFIFSIDNMVHNFQTLGLRGKCYVEDEFSFKNRISTIVLRKNGEKSYKQ